MCCVCSMTKSDFIPKSTCQKCTWCFTKLYWAKWWNIPILFSALQMTPLHWAAEKGHANTVHCLVEKGADINIKDGSGVSGLSCIYDCGLAG